MYLVLSLFTVDIFKQVCVRLKKEIRLEGGVIFRVAAVF
jgi:hypothetical protein